MTAFMGSPSEVHCVYIKDKAAHKFLGMFCSTVDKQHV